MSDKTEGRFGGITPELKTAIAPYVVQMPAELRAALDLPFEPADIKVGETRADGFTPTWVDPNTVIRRLNDCFGSTWSDHVVSHEFLWQAGQVIAVVRIKVTFNVRNPDGSVEEVYVSHDGVGKKTLNIINGNLIDPGDDLKAAVTDGLKTAARKFGIGMQLWDATPKLTPAAQQAQQEQQFAPAPTNAAKFQVDAIIKYFETDCGETRATWMHNLQIVDLAQITPEFAQYVLSGNHPYAQWQAAQKNVYINPALRSSNAR